MRLSLREVRTGTLLVGAEISMFDLSPLRISKFFFKKRYEWDKKGERERSPTRCQKGHC